MARKLMTLSNGEGYTFGLLRVLGESPSTIKTRRVIAICECGESISVDVTALNNCNVRSCGCEETEEEREIRYSGDRISSDKNIKINIPVKANPKQYGFKPQYGSKPQLKPLRSIGKTFGFLTFKCESPSTTVKRRVIAECSCGEIVSIPSESQSVSCGCKDKYEIWEMEHPGFKYNNPTTDSISIQSQSKPLKSYTNKGIQPLNVINPVFNRLTFLGESPSTNKTRRGIFKCSCGEVVSKSVTYIRNADSKSQSCGCLRTGIIEEEKKNKEESDSRAEIRSKLEDIAIENVGFHNRRRDPKYSRESFRTKAKRRAIMRSNNLEAIIELQTFLDTGFTVDENAEIDRLKHIRSKQAADEQAEIDRLEKIKNKHNVSTPTGNTFIRVATGNEFDKPHVYLVQTKPGEPVKIGVAVDIKKRIHGLQTSHYEKINLLAFVENGGYELEFELHQKFKHLRLTGEWFTYSNEIVEEFERLRNDFEEKQAA
jgi:hypothetical protein